MADMNDIYIAEEESLRSLLENIDEDTKSVLNTNFIPRSIEEFSKDVFNEAQLKEIERGIKSKINVDIYADSNYNHRQMREIRFGLERKLDVTKYNSKYYQDLQMHEIRLGMQDGLNVSSYAKLYFTANRMRKVRRDLFAEQYADSMDTLRYDYDDNRFGMHIYVEPGLMEAGIILSRDLPGHFTKKNLLRIMESYDITEGFAELELPRNLSNLPKGAKIPVMHGKPAVFGKDGYYEFLFNFVDNTPVVNENGSVDYFAGRNYTSVKKGSKIAVYHCAEKGEDGLTVTGIPLKGSYGKELESLTGDVELLEDGITYVATKDGFINFHDGSLSIMDNLEFKEDLTVNDGNINYEGNVIVKGSVHEGVVISSSGDIVISGYVESATLNAGGDIIISGGVNADGVGVINAEHNIVAGFFENANISAGGNIETGYILNCDIECKGMLTTKGKRSMISGGYVSAGDGIQTAVIGSKARNRTVVEISSDGDSEEYMECAKERDRIDADIAKIEVALDAMVQKVGETLAKQNEAYIKLSTSLDFKREDREDIQRQLAVIEQKRIERNQRSINVSNVAYENSVICINGNKLTLKEDVKNPIFKSQGRTIINANSTH